MLPATFRAQVERLAGDVTSSPLTLQAVADAGARECGALRPPTVRLRACERHAVLCAEGCGHACHAISVPIIPALRTCGQVGTLRIGSHFAGGSVHFKKRGQLSQTVVREARRQFPQCDKRRRQFTQVVPSNKAIGPRHDAVQPSNTLGGKAIRRLSKWSRQFSSPILQRVASPVSIQFSFSQCA